MSFALGVRTSIYNSKMRQLRKDAGITQVEIDDMFNMPRGTVSKIETFKEYPEFEKLEDIALYLNSTIEELFPEWLREQRAKVSSFDAVAMVEKLTLEAPEVLMLESPDPVELTEKQLMEEELHKLLESLSDRERIIIERRFGLNGFKEHTLQEVGEEFGVTRDRVRQIEARTLSKLRQNKGSKKVEEMYYGE